MIKVYEPKFGDDELKAVKRVFKSGNLTQGEEVRKFEEEMASYLGAKHVIAVNSCTSALFLSFFYKKNEIRTAYLPSVTFVSVANEIIHVGINLIFIDEIFVGKPYEIGGTDIIDSAHYIRRNTLKGVEKYKIFCYSFYPTKLLGGAEGGMIATNDSKAAAWFRAARGCGMERKSSWDYRVEFPGWKMNMTDVQAAILRTRLKKLDEMNLKRELIRDIYNEQLNKENESLHVYPIHVDNREFLMKKLQENGIATSVHFKPIHLQPAYNKGKDKYLYESEKWGRTELSLPLHENMKLKDIKLITNLVKKYGSNI